MTPRVHLSINFLVSEAVACTVAPPEQIDSIPPLQSVSIFVNIHTVRSFQPILKPRSFGFYFSKEY